MTTSLRILQCPLCKESTPVLPGSEASVRCPRCGIDLGAFSSFTLDVQPVPPSPAPVERKVESPPRSISRAFECLVVAFVWGLVGGVVLSVVLALVLSGLSVLIGGSARGGLVWGADLGMLLGGFVIGTWQAIKRLELKLLGGAALGALLGMLTAALHLGIEKNLLLMPESSWLGGLTVGLLAGATYGAYLGWNRED